MATVLSETGKGLRLGVVLLIMPFSAACAADGLSSQAVVEDSSGIRIVTYPSDVTPPVEWQRDPEPAVSIGVTAGAEPYEFSRIISAVPHGSGYLVADGGSGELRLFDEEGGHRMTAGRSGSGPGEFELLRWMGKIGGDSIVGWDLRLQRVSIFDVDLEHARTVNLRFAVPAYQLVGMFDDGDVLVWPFGPSSRSLSSAQVVEDTSYFAVAELGDGEPLDTVLPLPSRPTYIEPDGPVVRVPFTAEPSWAVSGQAVWAGSGQTGQLARYRQDGTVEMILRIPPGDEVTRQMADDFRSDDLTDYTGPQLAERERLLDEIPFPSELPAFDMIRVDSEGNLWVRNYLSPEAERQEWRVFDDTGEIIGAIALPVRFRISAITRDRIVGVARNELEVERVQVYRFARTTR